MGNINIGFKYAQHFYINSDSRFLTQNKNHLVKLYKCTKMIIVSSLRESEYLKGGGDLTKYIFAEPFLYVKKYG